MYCVLLGHCTIGKPVAEFSNQATGVPSSSYIPGHCSGPVAIQLQGVTPLQVRLVYLERVNSKVSSQRYLAYVAMRIICQYLLPLSVVNNNIVIAWVVKVTVRFPVGPGYGVSCSFPVPVRSNLRAPSAIGVVGAVSAFKYTESHIQISACMLQKF